MVLASTLYFQLDSIDRPQPDQNTGQDQIDMFSGKPVADNGGVQHSNPVKSNDTEITGHREVVGSSSGNAKNSSINIKRIEIFGRVVDEYNQPIENVLVSEDRYLFNTRSASKGQYRLTLELPKHKIPVLNFLRTGYEADRVDISTEDLKNDSVVELNVTLVESSESVKLDGWISNEIGESLPGQKIRIASWGYQGGESIYYTVISDEKGEFVFEAVKPNIEYELEVYTTPEYAPYSIEEMTVTRTPPRLNISLKPLKFIQISGMFVDSAGAPVPNFKIAIKNLSTRTHFRKIVSDSSGFFNLEKFPAGEMEFLSGAPEYFKINGLTLAENEYRNLILIIDRGIHQLSGWVSDQNGVAVGRAMVTLDAEILSGDIQSISIRSMMTDSTGKFHFDRLGDVEHMITIYAKGFDKKEQPHRFQSLTSEVHISLSRQ
jgi:hypothetical protein